MREIVLDTETTGLNPLQGHKLIEIGCVELFNRIPTGRTYHQYINPERDVPEDAFKIHGISTEFLQDKPTFQEIADDFLEFIGNDKLVIHNARFDITFLNHELTTHKRRNISSGQYFCTLMHARKKFPGASNNLDALCKRFNIDNTRRTYHGALLDSEILAEVYLELMGGKQEKLVLSEKDAANENLSQNNEQKENKEYSLPKLNIIRKVFKKRTFTTSSVEQEKHKKLVAGLEDNIW